MRSPAIIIPSQGYYWPICQVWNSQPVTLQVQVLTACMHSINPFNRSSPPIGRLRRRGVFKGLVVCSFIIRSQGPSAFLRDSSITSNLVLLTQPTLQEID